MNTEITCVKNYLPDSTDDDISQHGIKSTKPLMRIFELKGHISITLSL